MKSNLISIILLVSARGYCGHEHLANFGLINMNARLYDPYLGRFLSPDPYVQDPQNSQSLNRYTYCLNNPLKYTDPSGEIAFEILFGFVKGVVELCKGGNRMIHLSIYGKT